MVIYIIVRALEGMDMKSSENDFNAQIDRLKQNLINDLSLSDIVYIVPHKRMDFDALASACAMAELMKQLNIVSCIVTDDDETFMEENLQYMYNSLKLNYHFINTNDLAIYSSLDKRDLVIVVDANKEYLVPIQSQLPIFKKIVLIDHHNTDEHTIKADYGLINPEISSASEIVYSLLKEFNVDIDIYLAHCLLAGIYLDTASLSRNFKYSTAKTVSELMELGASSDAVRDLFVISNFKLDRQQQKEIDQLIDNTIFRNYGLFNVAITMNLNMPYSLYSHEVLAKCADELLKYDISASFVIGFTDYACLGEGHSDIVSIKARSKGNFDVSAIMKQLGGGGNNLSSACEIEISNVNDVRTALLSVLYNNIATDLKPLVLVKSNTKKAN